MNAKLERKLNRGMTVAELIEALEGCNPEAKVVFTCDYGDYCHTTQALPVCNFEDSYTAANLKETAYSKSGLALEETEEGDEDDEARIANESDAGDEADETPIVVLS